MRTVHLHGALGEKYGTSFELDVATAAEAVCALCANFPEITQDFLNGAWHLVRGKKDSGISLDEDQIASFRLGRGDLHVMPVVHGAKNNGVLKTVLGVALIGISMGFAGALAAPILGGIYGGMTYAGAVGMVGLGMALNGVSQLLAQSPDDEGDEQEGSKLISGGNGTVQEGNAVPLVYGEVITGGYLISSSIDIEQGDEDEGKAIADPSKDPASTRSVKDFYGRNIKSDEPPAEETTT